ncbi:ATP-binding protein [Rhodococcoides yunnanense]|uniref:ATP-binding protein n=1 Tax=Rhodococcoides yunnanense TaxID=278209 RepID=A0ABU4BK83_9NOCA|nr:ATP-binding protein [Rhodococcus yunnanensis]MDV6264619.1 ATP-binding protein [Rhodococcus yunnanensis]
MEYGLNPFTPGSGTRPPELVGRTAELERFDLLIALAKQRRYDRGLMLQGLRGVGKTTLLATMADQARRNNWVVVEVEAQTSVEGAEGLRRRIAKDISRAVRRRKFAGAVGEKIRQLTEEFSVSATAFGVGVELTRSEGSRSSTLGVEFEDLVEDLTDELRKDGTALGLFIDEMQELEPALLQVILATQHRAAQREWPFFLCGAGLPSLAQALADARSYAERQFDYRTIGPLADEQARKAISAPINRLNQAITAEATDYIVAASDGYPYSFRSSDTSYGKRPNNRRSHSLMRRTPSTPATLHSIPASTARGGFAQRRPKSGIWSLSHAAEQTLPGRQPLPRPLDPTLNPWHRTVILASAKD